MNLDAEITRLSIAFIKHDYTWQDLIRDDLPVSINQNVAAIIGYASSNKELLEQESLPEYWFDFASRGKRNQPRNILHARAILICAIERTMSRVMMESYVSGTFGDSLLLNLFPELEKEFNDEKLLPIRLFKILPDALEYKGHAISFSRVAPYPLIKELCTLADATCTLDLKVQPDHYRISPLAQYSPSLKKALYYGKCFDEAVVFERIFQKNLPCELRRFPETRLQELFAKLNPIESLQVSRHEQAEGSGVRISYLAEELIPLDQQAGSRHIATKIFHSDLYAGQRLFKHIDASYLVYHTETYQKRLAAKMIDKVKAEGHHKLFWLGSGDVILWKKLFHCVYPQNELIEEYLTGKPFRPEADTD